MFPKGIVWYENYKMEGVFDLSDVEVEILVIWWYDLLNYSEIVLFSHFIKLCVEYNLYTDICMIFP